MKTVWTITKWLVIIVACLFILLQLKRPARTNPVSESSQSIEAHVQMTPQVKEILDRSCSDCHSNNTKWPWYTNVAPVSWFIVDDVNQGRERLNLSEWGRMDRDRQDKKLRQICDEVEDSAMPLPSYLRMHPNAKLSEQDKKTLCDWTAAERERLSSTSK
jgi:hypothetical protein